MKGTGKYFVHLTIDKAPPVPTSIYCRSAKQV